MLFVRDVIRLPDKGMRRIVGMVDEDAILFDLGSAKTRLDRSTLAELVRGVNRGKVTLVGDYDSKMATAHFLSVAQRERAEKLYVVIAEILREGAIIFDKAQRGHLVSCAAKRHKLDGRTIHTALHRFWKGGMVLEAMVPGFNRCGGAGKQRSGTAQLGRGGPRNARAAPRLTKEILIAFEQGTRRYYRNNSKNSRAQAFRLILDDLLTECIFDPETGAPITFVRHDAKSRHLPTERQYRYWYQKQNRAASDAEVRTKSPKFQQRHRPKLSYAAEGNENIGGRYVIDSTPLDLNLVSRVNAATFISTPTLYLVTDELTGLIAGFSLSMEDASWAAAGLALLNAVEDKVSLCAGHGICISEQDWPVHDLIAMQLLYDKGEAKGAMAEAFVLKSSLTVQNTASGRGDLKGIVEQRFDLVNEALRGFVPGYRDKKSGQRGEEDPRREAILTLPDAMRVIVHTILFLNNCEIPTFRRSRAMIEDDVPPIPMEMWNWAMRTGRTALMRRTYEEMMVALLPTGTATITQQGLQFDGLCYTCETAITDKWFEHVVAPARARKLVVSYHPWVTDVIYVHHKSAPVPEVATLTPHSERFAGLSFAELKQVREFERGNKRNRSESQTVNHASFRNQVQQIVDQAASRRFYRLRDGELKGARDARHSDREFERDDFRHSLLQQAQVGLEHLADKADPAWQHVPQDDLGEGGALFSRSPD